MPLALISEPMPIEQFHAMPHRLGWKHEYWDGRMRLSPSHTAIADFTMMIYEAQDFNSPPEQPQIGTLRGITVDDETQLIQLHLDAFETAVEYAGYDDDHYRKLTTQSIRSFLGHGQGKRPTAGRVELSQVIEQDGRLIAAMLIRKEPEELIVQPVMVAPEHQRYGLARRLVNHVSDLLRAANHTVLRSRCHLGNAASMNWHTSVGFEEQPSMFAASHRYQHHLQMVRHHKTANRPQDAEYHRELANAYGQLHQACKTIEYAKYLET